MHKTMETLRNNLVENTTTEKLLETSTTELTRELNKKETNIYLYICELVATNKLNKGYQFSIKRFNSMFINWENGKSTEKTSTLPTLTDIVNACKYFYTMNGKEKNFMPIVRINNDGCIIVDCVDYVENYYSKGKEKTSTELTRDKAIKELSKMLDRLETLSSVLDKSDINDFIKSIKDLKATNNKVVKVA